jgi:hypothetical protein
MFSVGPESTTYPFPLDDDCDTGGFGSGAVGCEVFGVAGAGCFERPNSFSQMLIVFLLSCSAFDFA